MSLLTIHNINFIASPTRQSLAFSVIASAAWQSRAFSVIASAAWQSLAFSVIASAAWQSLAFSVIASAAWQSRVKNSPFFIRLMRLLRFARNDNQGILSTRIYIIFIEKGLAPFIYPLH
jgi:hypothetical protein